MDKRRGCDSHGYILLDVLISTIILAVALLSIGGLYVQSSRSNIFADNRTVALNWAQERIEYLKSNADWRGNSVTKTDPVIPTDTGTPPRAGFSRTTIVGLANVTEEDLEKLPETTVDRATLIAATNKRLIFAIVKVNWKEKGVCQEVELKTYIARD